ncbi:uncharacterized protein LOC143020583 [Oratosquilla oratoria]|uniref:uncharacterized protein LOC143020583 n=1 Tax=Oratosquilla oratoria TaxID=337810 RepID=UPI003F75891F
MKSATVSTRSEKRRYNCRIQTALTLLCVAELAVGTFTSSVGITTWPCDKNCSTGESILQVFFSVWLGVTIFAFLTNMTGCDGLNDRIFHYRNMWLLVFTPIMSAGAVAGAVLMCLYMGSASPKNCILLFGILLTAIFQISIVVVLRKNTKSVKEFKIQDIANRTLTKIDTKSDVLWAQKVNNWIS